MTWWWLIPAVLGAPLTLVLHELSHVVIALAAGAKITDFRPWPHRSGERFMFGSMRYDGTLGGLDACFYFAPLLKASLMLFAWVLASSLWCWHLWPLAAWELVDFAWWWRGWFLGPPRDGGRYREVMKERARKR